MTQLILQEKFNPELFNFITTTRITLPCLSDLKVYADQEWSKSQFGTIFPTFIAPNLKKFDISITDRVRRLPSGKIMTIGWPIINLLGPHHDHANQPLFPSISFLNMSIRVYWDHKYSASQQFKDAFWDTIFKRVEASIIKLLRDRAQKGAENFILSNSEVWKGGRNALFSFKTAVARDMMDTDDMIRRYSSMR